MQRIDIDQNTRAWILKAGGSELLRCTFDPSIKRASYYARLVVLKRYYRALRKNGLA